MAEVFFSDRAKDEAKGLIDFQDSPFASTSVESLEPTRDARLFEVPPDDSAPTLRF